jgi:MoxR-like ATPase
MTSPDQQPIPAPDQAQEAAEIASRQGEHHDILFADNAENSMPHIRSMANGFLEDGVAEYDRVIAGERDSKVLYVAALAMGGQNASIAVTLAIPGTGKSRLLKYAERIVEGLGSDQVGIVPHREDLTGAELTGKSSKSKKSGTKDGQEYSEEFVSELEAILHPGVAVVKLDEWNRASPLATNAGLELLQDGTIAVERHGVSEVISAFDLISATMNYYGTLFTHSFDPAVLSRLAYGTEMGRHATGQLSEGAEAVWDTIGTGKYVGDPEVIPIISRPNLQLIRSAIPKVDFASEYVDLGKKATRIMRDSLLEPGLDLPMGDARMSTQLVRVAQTLALLRGKEKGVGTEEIVDGSELMLTAKLGASGIGDPTRTGKSLEKSVQEILDKIAA